MPFRNFWHVFAPRPPANDLHWLIRGTVASKLDFPDTGTNGWEECGLPAAKSTYVERTIAIGHGVIHHVDQTVDVPR